jgi:hypothetical protein
MLFTTFHLPLDYSLFDSRLLPELLTLGDYEPEQRTGPAIWLRCIVDGALPDVKLPEKSVPVLYLPKVSRQLLRSPEECPDELKPLVELQYRGAVWTQLNGKDWTVEAFLVSESGGLKATNAKRGRRLGGAALGQSAEFGREAASFGHSGYRFIEQT